MIRPLFFIAFRHLLARRRQSLFTVLGLAIGVMVLISSVSMMDGLKVSFIKQMLQVSPHLTIKPEPAIAEPMLLFEGKADLVDLSRPEAPEEDTEIRVYRDAQRKLSRVEGVEVAAPELVAEGFIVYGSLKRSAQVHGVIPSLQEGIGNLAQRMVAGSYSDFSATPDGAILGYRLAEKMTIDIGDSFQAVGKTGELITLRASAFMKTGVTSYDSSHALIHLDRAQQLSGVSPDRVSNINIRVTDPAKVEPVQQRAERAVGLTAESWKETHKNVLSLFTMIGRTSYFLVVFTMLAAGLGVSNMLTTAVLQKRRDIAVLMSMGYSRRQVSFVFLVEGVALGTAGALLGCLLGYLNTLFIGSLPFDFGESAIISRSNLYMNQSVWYYALSAAFGFAVSLVAGVAPARRASRLDPVEIIRTEV